jgi:hypothetical protein
MQELCVTFRQEAPELCHFLGIFVFGSSENARIEPTLRFLEYFFVKLRVFKGCSKKDPRTDASIAEPSHNPVGHRGETFL